MTDRERLLEMLARVHSGDAWHGPSVMDVAGDVTASEADARPLDGAHTIAELARHVVAWRDEVCARVRGNEPSVPAAGDWPAVPTGGWAETVAELDRSFRELRDAIRQIDAARWEKLVGPSREAGLGTGVTTAVMLHGIVQHDAYHAGQMALLKKNLRTTAPAAQQP